MRAQTKKTAGSMTSGLLGSQSLNRTICLCPGALRLSRIRHVCTAAFVSKVSRPLASPYLDRASDHCSIVAKVSHCGQTYFAIRWFDVLSADLVPLRPILVQSTRGPPLRSATPGRGFRVSGCAVVTALFDPDPVKEASYGQHLGQGEMTLC